MTNPNRTVANFRRNNPFPERERRPVSEFTEWLVVEANKGVRFATIEEARAEFERTQNAADKE